MDDSRYTTAKHPTDRDKFLICDNKEETAKAWTVQGHMVYIRMTERAENQGGIILPQKSRDESYMLYEVIAIGSKVGTYRPFSLKYKNVPHFQRNAVVNFEVGDIVQVPERATDEMGGYMGLVKRSPVSSYEGMVDASLILAKVA